MKRKINFLLFIILSLFIFIPSVKAEDYYNSNSYPYVITKYDVNIDVNEDNSYDIEENIDVYFNENRHGIIRNIPYKNTVKREDGSESTNSVKITNISVSEGYSKSYVNNNVRLQIGSSDETITGAHSYTIKYKYNLGRDPLKDSDEFYYNIIGTSWDCPISNVSFTINMPKKFDKDKLGFSTGTYGSEGYDPSNLTYNVNDKTITGTLNGTLVPNSGLTVRLKLDDGYFITPKRNISDYLIFIIPIVMIIISYILWSLYGRDDLVVDTVEFYPPDGVNSLEAGFLYNGSAVNKDVTSLLIYLANKGYLTITESENKNILSTSGNFTLKKVKDYDGTNEYEKTFLNGLFESSDEVTLLDLENKFYRTTNKILRSVNSKENKNKIFDKGTRKIKNIIALLGIIVYIVITVIPLSSMGDTSLAFSIILFGVIGYIVVLISLDGISSMSKGGSIFSTVMFTIMFMILPWLTTEVDIIFNDSFLLLGCIIGFISVVIITVFYKLTDKRTKYGIEILGKLRGFKNFLETAEKEKLEALVNEHPNYFYDILPYTYVLGVSSKWIKKFESINIEAPTWYYGYTSYNFDTFTNSMDNMISTSTTVFTSNPASSSSGSGFISGGGSGFSGGGFSGGGFGGGGGSSW